MLSCWGWGFFFPWSCQPLRERYTLREQDTTSTRLLLLCKAQNLTKIMVMSQVFGYISVSGVSFLRLEHCNTLAVFFFAIHDWWGVRYLYIELQNHLGWERSPKPFQPVINPHLATQMTSSHSLDTFRDGDSSTISLGSPFQSLNVTHSPSP